MNRIVRGEDDGKRRLAEILGRDGDDYQRCLWYSVAGRDPLAVATCFSELEKLMAARASLWVETSRRGLAPSKTDNPYRSEEHTSELQSLMRISYAVFCLKKKKKDKRIAIDTRQVK